MLTLDFETYYDREYSLKKLTTEAYIRDPRFEIIGVGVKQDHEPAAWFSGNLVQISDFLRGFDIPNQQVVAHHAAFDGAILNWHLNLRPKLLLDTLSMSRPITGLTVGGSLEALAAKFCLGEKGSEVHSALGKRRHEFTEQELGAYGEYCKNDVELTYVLFQVLRQFSTPQEMFIADLMLRMFTEPVLRLDKAALEAHLRNVRARKARLMDKIGGVGMPELMSSQQFASLLEKFGVDPPMKNSPAAAKRGEVKMTYAFAKTDAGMKALLEHPNEVVQALAAARLGARSTLEETRTEAFLAIADRGALPIMLNYYGAHTGRASGGDKINPQNLPRGGALRKAIKAPDGYVLVAGDSSQIEARKVAWLAGQSDLVEDFRNGVDIYSKFATDVYGRPIDRNRIEVKDGKEFKPDFVEGFVGKTCILGLGFGMGTDKFHLTLKNGQVSVNMPLPECDRIVKLYRSKYDRIKALWKSADDALRAMAQGYEAEVGVGIKLRCTPDGIHLPNGMMIRYPGLRQTDKGFCYDNRKQTIYIYGAKMVENIVQALARIVVFNQMAKLEQYFRGLDDGKLRRVVLTVHDEVVAVVPEEEAETTKALMESIMGQAPKWASDLPVACEVAYGQSYGDAK